MTRGAGATSWSYSDDEDIRPTLELASYYTMNPASDYWYQFGLIWPQWELIESGRAECRTPFGRCVAGPGTLMCLRPASRMLYGVTAGTRFYQIQLRFAPPPNAHLVPWFEGVGALPLCIPLGDAFEQARRLFEIMCIELPTVSTGEHVRVRGAIFELLAVARDAAAESRQGHKSAASAEASDVWHRSRRRLELDLDQPLRVEDLAREARVSLDHFTREFRRRFGTTPSACRTRAKLREAVRQLRSGDRSVKAVAYGLGFGDPDAFTRLFKRHIGVVPSGILPNQNSTRLDLLAKTMPRGSEGRLHPVNKQILPFGFNSPAPWEHLTESVSRVPPPCAPEDYIYLRRG